MELNLKNTPLSDRYRLLTGCIVPRPIAWVSSVDESGLSNLAPFSFFNAVSSDPCILVVAPGPKLSAETGLMEKDTLRNIKATGEFVVNIVSRELAGLMNDTASELPQGVSEFEKFRIETAPSHMVRAPRVAASPVSFECKLHQLVELAQGGGLKAGAGTLILGEVIYAHVDDAIVTPGKHGFYIDAKKLDAVGRLSGNEYCTTRDAFTLNRP